MRKLPSHQIPRAAPGDLADMTRHPVRLVVENVRSAFNVGSILRTADALLVEHVHLTGFSPPGDHRSVHKSALGAQDSVPWSHDRDIAGVLDTLVREGFTLAAVEITDTPSRAANLQARHFPIALILGNEVAGVSDETLARCDLALELPQFGLKHSLNVAVAAGVVGYDVTRRWHELTDPE